MNDTKNAHFKPNGTSPIVIILSLIAIMVMFTESMLIPALPTLQAEFDSQRLGRLGYCLSTWWLGRCLRPSLESSVIRTAKRRCS